MPAKKYQDGAYYWVRRRSHVADNQVLHAPHWEPMLWDAPSGKFVTRARGSDHLIGEERTPAELADIGERIERHPKRTTRKAWIPMFLDAAGKLRPDTDGLTSDGLSARHVSFGTPLPVEVAWENERLNELRAAVRESRKPCNL